MSTLVFLSHRIAVTSLHGIPPFPGIGVGVGTAMGVAPFSSSSSLLAINSDVTSTFTNSHVEPGVTHISDSSSISQDGAWYEINLRSMHSDGFWEEFNTFVLASLNPSRLYGLLLQPRSQVRSITIGISVNITSKTTLDWLENNFMPLLARLEKDYNEEFNLDTWVKIRDLGALESPPTPRPSPSPKESQTRTLLSAIENSNKTLIGAMQTQSQALLEGMKATSFNWDPVVTVGTTLVDRILDRLLPPQPTQAPTATPAPQPQQSAAIGSDPILARLDSLSQGGVVAG